jgi:hypothetical protein
MQNEHAVLSNIRLFGHLRAHEVAAVVWPEAKYGLQMAHRLLNRLGEAGLILARKNTLGSTSYVLTTRGAGRLDLMGLPCRHGRDIVGVAGATFLHRTLATRYLIERQVAGAEVLGEYAIAHGWAPLTKDTIAKRFGKLPDGFVFYASSKRGDEQRLVDWVEVEQAAKPLEDLKAVVRQALRLGEPLGGKSGYFLSRLVIVFARSENHASRILKAASQIWADRNISNFNEIEARIMLVFVDVGFPLRWQGHQSISLNDYRRQIA